MMNQMHQNENSAIIARRTMENKMRTLNKAMQDDLKLTYKANWEHRTAKVMKTNQLRQMVRTMEAADQRSLHERRQRLAHMLAEEERQFRQEIDAQQETTADRAARMLNRARALKEEREKKRRTFANEQYARVWRDGCDDLRTIDSEKFSEHCRVEMEKQVQLNRRLREKEKEEEDKWAVEWQKEQERRNLKAEEEKEQRAKFNADTNKALLDQMDDQKRRRRAEQENIERERLEFQQQMERDAAAARLKAEEEAEALRVENEKISTFNSAARKRKEEENNRQREQDRQEMLRMIAEHDRVVEQEKADKDAIQRDAQEYADYLRQQRLAEEDIEARREELIKEELKKENHKRDLQWQKEALARQKLNEEVERTRVEQMQFHRDRRVKEEAERQEEFARIEKEAEEHKRYESEQARKRADREAQLKHELENQIKANNARRGMMERREEYLQQQADRAEQEYQQFLADQRRDTTGNGLKNYGKKTFRWD